MDPVTAPPDLLLVTVTKVESQAVLAAFERHTGEKARIEARGDRAYQDLGLVNGVRAWLAISEMGSGGLSGTLQTVTKAIEAIRPAGVILVGIAFGVNSEKQAIGDILLAKHLRLYDLQRVGTGDKGGYEIRLRGARPDCSGWLLNACKTADLHWHGAKVRPGCVLSGDKLVDNFDFRAQLLAFEPEAIGGEMEGAGLYVACQDEKVDWLVVKAICDWADGRKEVDKSARQQLAATNAAEFVLHVLVTVPLGTQADHGGTPPPPVPTGPEIASLLTGPLAAREFATLIQRLVIHQGRLHGFADRIRMDSRSGGCWIADGFPGFKGSTFVQACWLKSAEPLDEAGCAQAVAEHLATEFPASAAPDNYLPVFPVHLLGPRVQTRQNADGDQDSDQPRLVMALGSADLMDWLRDCPALLARYYPQEAANLPGQHGFHAQSLSALGKEFVRMAREHPDHANLQFLGIPPGVVWAHPDQGQAAPRLKDIFVPLSFGKWGQSGADTQSEVALDSLIAQPGPRVILGDPGSGKTTILHYLVLRQAGGLEANRVLAASGASVPMALFLALPDFVRFEKDRPGVPTDFVDYWLHQAQSLFGLSAAHRWLFESALEMGEAVVLLDSLDEVGQLPARSRLAGIIERFHQRFPQAPVWVTSRIVGYEGPDCANARVNQNLFGHYVIQKLSPDQQRLFIEQWFGRQWTHDPRQAQAKVSALLKARQNTPGVARLASNPLLLTLMAFIHGKRGLPRYRGEVYEKCVECLLESWPEARGSGSLSGQTSLADLDPPIQPRRYLSALALHTQEANAAAQREAASEADVAHAPPEDDERRNRIPDPFLREVLEQLRLGDFGVDEEHPATQAQREQARSEVTLFLNYIRFRTGLLLYRGGDGDAGEFRFAHLTFLEYLAAVQLADTLSGDALTDFFLSHAEHPAWTEVLLLLLFRVSERTSARPVFQRLVNAALEAGQSAGFWRTMGLAVRDELPFLDRDATEILRYLISEWCRGAAFSGEPFKTLQDIAEFSPRKHPLLLNVLAEHCRQEEAAPALLALHLRVVLLGWPHADAAESGRLATELMARLNTANKPAQPRPLFERAGLLLAAAGPAQFVKGSPGAQAVSLVRERLQVLSFQSALPIQERDGAAQALGWLGDPRKGVGLDANALPAPDFETALLPPQEKFKCLEKPGNPDRIETLYRLARYPVTVAQFMAFATPENYADKQWWTEAEQAEYWKDGRLKVRDWSRGGNEEWVSGPATLEASFNVPNHPMVMVNWFEAMAFCRWLSRQRGLDPDGPEAIRLPTEAEWEQAVRWNKELNNQKGQADARRYPWDHAATKTKDTISNDELASHCNCSETGIGHTSAVGLFPDGASECGALDMSGNVWEWCENWYDSGQKYRGLRGGSWGNVNPEYLSCSYRFHGPPTGRYDYFGFRCVVGLGAAVR